MRRTAALSQVITACLLGLVLAGCGSANPKPAPPATKSLTPSPSPSAVAPTMPAEAKGTGPEAAKAFVRHYLATFSYATRTGDVKGLALLSTTSCRSCDAVIAQIKKLYAAGGHSEGRGYAASAITVDGSTQNKMSLTTRVVLFPQRVYATQHARPETSNRDESPTRFNLSRNSSGWVIREWSRIS